LGCEDRGRRGGRGAGRTNREGNGGAGGGVPLLAIWFGGEGKQRGEWGVNRGSAVPFPREKGTSGRRAR
jgi:hypothetical protein